MDRLVIQQDAVSLFSVFAKSLAMISHDSYERVFVKAISPQTGEEFPHRGVSVSNLPIIRRGGVSGLVRLRRVIWIMRIVNVHTKEKRVAAGLCPQPPESAIYDISRTALHAPISVFSCAALMKSSVIGLESPVKTACRRNPGIKYHRTDKCGGAITRTMQ